VTRSLLTTVSPPTGPLATEKGPGEVQITRVAVVGAGIMGSGIAEVCIRAGVDTVLLDVDEAFVAKGRGLIEKSLTTAVARGKIDDTARDGALDQLSTGTDLKLLEDRDLVVEAIVENEGIKSTLFAEADRITGPDAVLASNTSSIPIVRLATATNRPGRVLGMHFFNPAPVQPLVELIPALTTDPAVVDAVETFTTTQLGKKTIRCRDQAGFVVNALLVPYLLAAIRVYESGAATAIDIDEGMKNGCAHPMGPLALCDLVGLDTLVSVADVMYDEFKEQLYAPPPLLRRMVSAGRLGRKSGRGFYEYGS
jgi:3-hydroxybutyryl-CoA dehydrogenase